MKRTRFAQLRSFVWALLFLAVLLSEVPTYGQAPATSATKNSANDSDKPIDRSAKPIDKSAKPEDKTDSKSGRKSQPVEPTKTPQTPEQRQLAEDSAKLLVLANELKAELDKSTKDTLSLTVVKKAEEVEKLAHKVKEEMKKTMVNN